MTLLSVDSEGLWHLDQVSRQLLSFCSSLRTRWDDEASRTIVQHYLSPREKDDESARKNLHLQEDVLRQAYDHLSISIDHLKRAAEFAEDLQDKFSLVLAEQKTTHQRLDSYAAFKANAIVRSRKSMELVDQASCKCKGVKGNPVPNRQFENINVTEKIGFESLRANGVYVVGDYVFETDGAARLSVASGWLHLGKGERDPTLQKNARKLGLHGDEGGHIFGVQFEGPAQAFNLSPQTYNLNRIEWSKMESIWATALKQGMSVYVIAHPVYADSSNTRPIYFEVMYEIGIEKYTQRFFQNI